MKLVACCTAYEMPPWRREGGTDIMSERLRELLDELAKTAALEQNDEFKRVPVHTAEVNRLAREIAKVWDEEG